MQITVVGHLCLDVIHRPDGGETESYGGIFYSVAALANLLGPKDVICPVFGVGRSEYEEFLERLKPYPNVDTSGIYRFNGPTNKVELVYKDSQERVECSTHIAEPVPWKKIRPFLETDMVLINMISGLDISLETLDELRMEVRERHLPIYMDVHSLTLGINEDATRFRRPIDNWRRWLFMVHAVQMNEEEAAGLSTERLPDADLAQHVLALNTTALIITRGNRGCTVFIDQHKHVQRSDIPAVPISGVVDPTGCGDVFAASYCAHYLKTKDILGSTQFANKVAARKAELPGSVSVDTLASFCLHEVPLSE
jgi:sugar/nucleoside kinase (ribokinase family)